MLSISRRLLLLKELLEIWKHHDTKSVASNSVCNTAMDAVSEREQSEAMIDIFFIQTTIGLFFFKWAISCYFHCQCLSSSKVFANSWICSGLIWFLGLAFVEFLLLFMCMPSMEWSSLSDMLDIWNKAGLKLSKLQVIWYLGLALNFILFSVT